MSIKVVQKEFIKDDMRGRDSSIDLIKGIAILLVMSGHCIGFFQGVTESIKDDLINSFINSFHMPLFFLAGGYLHKQKTVTEALRLRFQSLIIPLILYVIVNGILTLIIHGMKSIELIGDENRDMLLQICKIRGEWFIVSYFAASIILSVLENRFADNRSLIGSIVTLLFMLSLIVSSIDKKGMTSYIITTFVGLFFYYFGTKLHPVIKWTLDRGKVFTLVIGVLLLLGCFFSNFILPNDIRMYSNTYGNVFLFILNSLLGCIGILLIGKGINHFAPLEMIGQLSLPIMAIQFSVYQAIGNIIQKNSSLYIFSIWPLCLTFYGTTIIASVYLAHLIDKFLPAFAGKYKTR